MLELTPTPSGGTHLEYNIRIASAFPGVAPLVASGLTRDIAKGLPLADERA